MLLHKKYKVLQSLNDLKFEGLQAQSAYCCMTLCCCHVEILVKILVLPLFELLLERFMVVLGVGVCCQLLGYQKYEFTKFPAKWNLDPKVHLSFKKGLAPFSRKSLFFNRKQHFIH
jgi:hypothetical protein